jgi:arylsulfatase A-like enzyme
MQKNKSFIKEVTNGKACLPLKAQKRHAAGTTALGLALMLPVSACAPESVDPKPNIIFIMVDDMGYHDLGCFGSKMILTPNIDGISIIPTLLGKGRQETHKYLFWQEGKRAVRMGHWKGIGMPGAVKLYDLRKDIGEKNDLAEQHPDIAKQIGDIMAEAWVDPRSQQDDGRYPAPR